MNSSYMRDPLRKCLRTSHGQPSTRVSSASTLCENPHHQGFVKLWDPFACHTASLIEHRSTDIPSDGQPSSRARSEDHIPYKRRKPELDCHTWGRVRWLQSRLDERVQRPRHRSSSLDCGSRIYHTWTVNSFEHDSAILPEENVVKTDPEDITLLWEKVSMISSRLPQPPKAASEASVPTSEKVLEKKLKVPSPYDKDFGQRVLEPRSITINEDLHSMKAYKHFEVLQAVGDRVQYYINNRGAAASPVWLRDEEAFVQDIAREYACMTKRTLCEAEFASYARETLLKRHSRVLDLDQGEYERVWIPERMIELVAKPTPFVWKRPPLVGKHAKAGDTPYTNYEFDLRPDCAYWLSLQAINPEYRTQVKEHILVLNKTITSPYLTIEFKRDDSEEQVAWKQVAGAASVALYNRFLLRQRMLEASKHDWDIKQHIGPLRHYGMTFAGSCYMIWIVRPTVTKKGQWSGCRMDSLHHGDCESPAGVRDLIDWINKIHCWGLMKHGPECYNDVKLSFRAREESSGIRVSDVTSLIVDDLTET